MNRTLVSFVVLGGSLTAASADLISQYDFNNTLMPTLMSNDVTPTQLNNKNKEVAFTPGTGGYGQISPSYSTESVGGTTKTVLDVNKYGALMLIDGVDGNGYKYPHVYTIVEDVRLDSAKAFNLLTNQSSDELGAADAVYVNKNGYAGLSYVDPSILASDPDPDAYAYAKSSVKIDVTQWHRYAISVDLDSSIASVYADGNLLLSTTSIPSVSALQLTKLGNCLTFFGSGWFTGHSNELRQGYGANPYLSGLQFYDNAMSASEVKRLGSLNPVPEPATMVSAVVGLAFLAKSRKQRRK